jgi:ABC-type branched-subunit amino acid transport system ATPase component
VRHEGRIITGAAAIERPAGSIGFASSGHYNFLAPPVAENLRMDACLRRLPRTLLDTKIEQMTARFHRFKERRNALAGNMSGGEQ